MSAASLMNTVVTHKAQTQVKYANGYNSAPILTITQSNVPARVTKQTPDRAAILYGKYDAEKQRRIYYNQDPQLTSAFSWVNWNGKDYCVTSIENQGGELGRLWAVNAINKPFN